MLKCLEGHMTEFFHFILLHNFCEVNMEINLQFLWFFVILYIVVWEKFTKAGCWNKLHRILRTEFFRSVQIHKQTSTMEFIKSVVSPYKIAVGSGSSPDPTAQTVKKVRNRQNQNDRRGYPMPNQGYFPCHPERQRRIFALWQRRILRHFAPQNDIWGTILL